MTTNKLFVLLLSGFIGPALFLNVSINCAPNESRNLLETELDENEETKSKTLDGINTKEVQVLETDVDPTRITFKSLHSEEHSNLMGENLMGKTSEANGNDQNIVFEDLMDPSQTLETDSKFDSNTIQVGKVSVFAYQNFKGASDYFELSNNCLNLPEDWHKRISSLNTHGTCVEVCKFKNCEGICKKVAPGTLGHNRLRQINFDKRITSLRACSV